MKNREKFREEIIRSLSVANKANLDCGICDFVQKHVFPYFGDINNVEYKCNADIDCDICGIMFLFWLDEEYEEPEVDWDNVPVDTLVRVRDREEQEWTLRYFRSFGRIYSSYPPGYDYEVWALGATSVTAEGETYIEDPAGEFRVFAASCEWDSELGEWVPDAGGTETEILNMLD